MTITNCAECGKEVDTLICQETPEGDLCPDCYFDYYISKGGYGAKVHL